MGRIGFLIAIIMLGSCSFEGTIADHTIGYNRAVNQVSDAQMMLNILRTRDSQSTTFVALQSLTGNLEQSVNGSGSLTIPFGGDASREFPLGLNLSSSAASKPVFTVQNLNSSQEFMNAILDPVSMDVVKLFWDQGWSKDFLVYMLVENVRIRIVDDKEGQKNKNKNEIEKNKPKKSELSKIGFRDLDLFGCECEGVGEVLENDPTNTDHFDCFEKIVDVLTLPELPRPKLEQRASKQGMDLARADRIWASLYEEKKLRLVDYKIEKPAGPIFFKDDKSFEFEFILDAKEKDLEIKSVDKGFQICDVRNETGFCISEESCSILQNSFKKCKGDISEENGGSLDSVSTNTLTEGGGIQISINVNISDFSYEKDVDKMEGNLLFCPRKEETLIDSYGNEKLEIIVNLRSLQGIIFFLGELLRESTQRQVLIRTSGISESCRAEDIDPESEQLPLIRLRKGTPQDAAISVDYKDGTYWIPLKDECSRSLQALAFLDQVFGIYKSRANIPSSSPTVTIER